MQVSRNGQQFVDEMVESVNHVTRRNVMMRQKWDQGEVGEKAHVKQGKTKER